MRASAALQLSSRPRCCSPLVATVRTPRRARRAKTEPSSSSSPSAASANTSLGEGAWLLALSSAGGVDAENATTTYVTYDPSTGLARARELPDGAHPERRARGRRRCWSVPTGAGPSRTPASRRTSRSSGRLTLYSLTSQQTKVIDIRQRTGDAGAKAFAWAFDPEQAEALRVVDSRNQVWSVNVSGGQAVKTGTLPAGPTGSSTTGSTPTPASPTSRASPPRRTPTRPATAQPTPAPSPARAAPSWSSDSEGLAELPASPCRLAPPSPPATVRRGRSAPTAPRSGPSTCPHGQRDWSSYGKPSNGVAPEAAGFLFALPPQE